MSGLSYENCLLRPPRKPRNCRTKLQVDSRAKSPSYSPHTVMVAKRKPLNPTPTMFLSARGSWLRQVLSASPRALLQPQRGISDDPQPQPKPRTPQFSQAFGAFLLRGHVKETYSDRASRASAVVGSVYPGKSTREGFGV